MMIINMKAKVQCLPFLNRQASVFVFVCLSVFVCAYMFALCVLCVCLSLCVIVLCVYVCMCACVCLCVCVLHCYRLLFPAAEPAICCYLASPICYLGWREQSASSGIRCPGRRWVGRGGSQIGLDLESGF